MNRAPCDSALLHSCDLIHAKLLKFCGACAIGMALAAWFYGVLAYASGAL